MRKLKYNNLPKVISVTIAVIVILVNIYFFELLTRELRESVYVSPILWYYHLRDLILIDVNILYGSVGIRFICFFVLKAQVIPKYIERVKNTKVKKFTSWIQINVITDFSLFKEVEIKNGTI